VDKVDSDLPLGLVDVMADMNHTNTAKWVVARIRISMDNKPVSFNELQAGIECFTQLVS
jgi:replication fork protection complex subunit Tof1/Swi1